MNRVKSSDLQDGDVLPFASFLDGQRISAFIDEQIETNALPFDDDEKRQMEEVVRRIRAQLRFIVRSVRGWQDRHDRCEGLLKLRYSAYEGAFCYEDLHRHWAYYRHAMCEYVTLLKG